MEEPLVDLEDVYRPFDDPSLKAVREEGEAQAKAPVDPVFDFMGPVESVERREPEQVVDLSQTQTQTQTAPSATAPSAPASVPAPSSLPAAEAQARGNPIHRIPANATGFGSEDLFGQKPQEQSALDAVYNFPEKVRQHVLADCMAPQTDEAPAAGGPVSVAPSEETSQVINRSLEGRWVPTYMRQQLVAGGHTALPSAPNGHEFSAAAPPPSLGQAFVEMGQDLGDGAQAVLEFMAAFFTSLSFQCQACTHQTVSTAHEQVLSFGDAWCGVEDEGPVSESVGPVGLGHNLNQPVYAQNVPST